MRYDLTIPIKNLEGVQIADAETPAGLTLRTVLARTALWVIRHKPPSALEKLAAYALARISLENVRQPDAQMPDFPLGLTMGMMLSIPMFLIGAWLVWRGLKKPPAPVDDEAAAEASAAE